jgi:hypothetical protein
MACHFVTALKIPSLQTIKSTLHNVWDAAGAVEDDEMDNNDGDKVDDNNDGDKVDDNNEDENDVFDVDTSMDIEAAKDDTVAIKATCVTSFRPGDVVGKIMAFIAQLRASSEDTREYLKKISISRGCNTLEIKVWVHGRWGSLSDCFRVILSQQKVCQVYCYQVNQLILM